MTMSSDAVRRMVFTAICVFSIGSASAMSVANLNSTANDGIVQVRGHGHHYGWDHGRGNHYGWWRGRHRGWYH
jgi:hypothetical protein